MLVSLLSYASSLRCENGVEIADKNGFYQSIWNEIECPTVDSSDCIRIDAYFTTHGFIPGLLDVATTIF